MGFNSSLTYKLMAHYSLVDPIDAFLRRPAIPEIDFSGVVCDLKGKNAQYLDTGR